MLLIAKRFCIAFLIFLVIAWGYPASAAFVIVPSGINPNGDSGEEITFGTTGSIFQLKGFISVAGEDRNGSDPGVSQDLAFGSAEEDSIEYTFSYKILSGRSSLLLTYQFRNTSSDTLNGLQFLSFVDADINSSVSYLDESGDTFGSLGSGTADSDADSWEIDEQGFGTGNLYGNILAGHLDNTNSLLQTSPDDASLALGFQIGALNPGDTAKIDILLSENGMSVGSFALKQFDQISPDTLTMSGQSSIVSTAVPEPTSMIPMGTGFFALAGYTWHRRRRSTR